MNACGLTETVDLRLEGSRLVIEAIKTPRADWFRDYDAERDVDAWNNLPLDADADADAGNWEW